MTSYPATSEKRHYRSPAAEYMGVMTQAATHPAPPRLSYSVAEASTVTGIGRTTLYKLMGDGTLASVKIGNRRLIPASALHSMLRAA